MVKAKPTIGLIRAIGHNRTFRVGQNSYHFLDSVLSGLDDFGQYFRELPNLSKTPDLNLVMGAASTLYELARRGSIDDVEALLETYEVRGFMDVLVECPLYKGGPCLGEWLATPKLVHAKHEADHAAFNPSAKSNGAHYPDDLEKMLTGVYLFVEPVQQRLLQGSSPKTYSPIQAQQEEARVRGVQLITLRGYGGLPIRRSREQLLSRVSSAIKDSLPVWDVDKKKYQTQTTQPVRSAHWLNRWEEDIA